jgi:hypothetical protein
MRGYDAEILDAESVSLPTNTRKLTIIDPLVHEKSSVADTGSH